MTDKPEPHKTQFESPEIEKLCREKGMGPEQAKNALGAKKPKGEPEAK